MKKIFLILLMLTMLAFSVIACQNGNNNDDGDTPAKDDGPEKEGIELSVAGIIEISVGSSETITVTNLATGMQTSNVVWKSDNESVASVNSAGVVSGKAEGSAIITATTIDGKYNASCTVSVSFKLSGVSLSYETYELEVGDSVKLEATPIPSLFEGATFTWISSSPSVADVDSEGNVTAYSKGKVSIMVTANPGEYTAICSIIVGKYAESLTLEPEQITLNKGVSVPLTYTVLPADATSRLHWKSSDESVVIVNARGEITAVGSGTAQITVYTTNGLSASCSATVYALLDKIEFEEEELTLKKRSEYELKVNYFPSDASNKTLEWTTSDDNVVIIEDGKLCAVGNGTAVVTATSDDGGYTASCTVTVNNPMESLAFEGEQDKDTGKYPTLQMQKGDVLAFKPVIVPHDADEIQYLVWESSSEEIVSVSSDGTLTANGIGKTTLTLTSPNGFSASCDIEVTKKIYPVEEIITSSNEYYMNPGDVLDVGLTYLPVESIEDAVPKSIVSTNQFVAYWNGIAGVIANATGTCQFTFTIQNPNGEEITHVITIHVVPAGTCLDDEYKSDTRALRDGDIPKFIREAATTLATLHGEKDSIEKKMVAETDPILLAEYQLRLDEIQTGIERAEQKQAYYTAQFEAEELSLAAKYSMVAEDITYDPASDNYPYPENDEFVKVTDYVGNIVSDLKYATTDNETGYKIYNFTSPYLRYGTAMKLKQVALLVQELGYKVVIWDAFRPLAADETINKINGDLNAEASSNCRGNTICITLMDENGDLVEMPSGFADETALADRNYSDVSEEASSNIVWLETLMKNNGFTLGDNWWEFIDSDNYDIDEDFLSGSVVDTEQNQ